MHKWRCEQPLPLSIEPHAPDTDTGLLSGGSRHPDTSRTEVSGYVQSHYNKGYGEETVTTREEVEETQHLHSYEK